jgi:SAM-dependent methyltransferase
MINKYNDKFYGDNSTRLESASEILNFVFNIVKPNSILDVGCGRGAWLKIANELGVENIYGIDGKWNDGKNIDKQIIYRSLDLNKNFTLENTFDLTICLEVAEHLEKNSSDNLISSLVKTSDIIVFSAAFKYQGGVNHINENLHSYWANLFLQYNFVPFDIIRPVIWSNDKVSYWYRQNTFLYLKKGSSKFEDLSKKYNYLKNSKLMDSIHPEMFFRKIEEQTVRYHAKEIIKKIKKKLLW